MCFVCFERRVLHAHAHAHTLTHFTHFTHISLSPSLSPPSLSLVLSLSFSFSFPLYFSFSFSFFPVFFLIFLSNWFFFPLLKNSPMMQRGNSTSSVSRANRILEMAHASFVVSVRMRKKIIEKKKEGKKEGKKEKQQY